MIAHVQKEHVIYMKKKNEPGATGIRRDSRKTKFTKNQKDQDIAVNLDCSCPEETEDFEREERTNEFVQMVDKTWIS